MANKDQSAALDVIGKKLREKAIIDQDFDAEELIQNLQNFNIENSTESELPKTVGFKLPSPDAGFNCICELNLGKIYKYYEKRDEEGNIVDQKRSLYPNSYLSKTNTKWLKSVLDQIENAVNPIVVVSDIFSRVTTGNAKENMPYTEQFLYIYQLLNKPNIKNKIVALVRGEKEKEIINNGGPDLMGKLAKVLGMEDKLVDAGFHLSVEVKGGARKISMLHYNKKVSSVKPLKQNMYKYANENPGHDVYFCTNAKINWQSQGVTTYTDENGHVHQKPCWFISFGPMYEFDKFNEKKPEIGPYTLNKRWYRVTFDSKNNVRTDYVDYTYPHSIKIDSSSYVGATMATELSETMRSLIEQLLVPEYQKTMEGVTNKTRKSVTKAIHQKSKKPAEQVLEG